MTHDDYPALYLDADSGSNRFQRLFLRLILGEYLLLLLAAIVSLSFLNGIIYYLLFAAIFFSALILSISRALSKPEQSWYRCRALAESVKTLTWRYMMHATPFRGDDAHAKIALREQLHSVFKENVDTAKMITTDWSGNNQITDAMKTVRAMTRAERMTYYLSHRVDDQRAWYSQKAKTNRKSARFWIAASIAVYVIAGAMVLSRLAKPDWQYWPIEPLIVLATAIVGWMQIKKFNELAAAYTVAAHEIGLIRPIADEVSSDSEFSEFVNDAEKAFSREHTLWIARQSD